MAHVLSDGPRAELLALEDVDRNVSAIVMPLTATIKEHLVGHLQRKCPNLSPRQIMFSQLRRGAPAHGLALAVYRGKEKDDRRVGVDELLAAAK